MTRSSDRRELAQTQFSEYAQRLHERGHSVEQILQYTCDVLATADAEAALDGNLPQSTPREQHEPTGMVTSGTGTTTTIIRDPRVATKSGASAGSRVSKGESAIAQFVNTLSQDGSKSAYGVSRGQSMARTARSAATTNVPVRERTGPPRPMPAPSTPPNWIADNGRNAGSSPKRKLADSSPGGDTSTDDWSQPSPSKRAKLSMTKRTSLTTRPKPLPLPLGTTPPAKTKEPAVRGETKKEPVARNETRFTIISPPARKGGKKDSKKKATGTKK